MKIKAVIFDLDGTITSFNLDYRAVRAEIISFLINAGMPASTLSMSESTFGMLKKTEIFMRNNDKSEKAIVEVTNKALSIIEKREIEAAKDTSLMSGVLETLKTLKKKDLKIGLCTINSEKSMQYILKRFNIAGYFDALTPRNKVTHVKPNTEHLQATLDALEVKADEAMIVGDGLPDMRCGKELKLVTVGFLTSESSKETLIEAGANYMITTLADVPMLVEQINKKARNKKEQGFMPSSCLK